MLIAPKVGGIKVKGGTLKADGQLAGTPSVLLDAIALVLAPEAATRLAQEGAAVDFVRDAFGHLKAIGCTPDAEPLLQRAGVDRDEGITGLDKKFVVAAGKRFFEREPKVRTLA
jgi:catalase